MTDLATLETRLSEAEEALHQLSIGKATVKLEEGPTALTYNQASVSQLRNYIRDLEAQIAQAKGKRGRRATAHAVFS